MKFEQDMKIKIPNIPGEPGVYVFYFLRDKKEIPFYVGETNNLRRRIGEYLVASFAAQTDFRVGEAIKYMQKNKCDVVVKFWIYLDNKSHRKKEESRLISKFRSDGLELLNKGEKNVGYNYRIDKREKVLDRIKKETKIILKGVP
jgi:hypothetical protein